MERERRRGGEAGVERATKKKKKKKKSLKGKGRRGGMWMHDGWVGCRRMVWTWDGWTWDCWMMGGYWRAGGGALPIGPVHSRQALASRLALPSRDPCPHTSSGCRFGQGGRHRGACVRSHVQYQSEIRSSASLSQSCWRAGVQACRRRVERSYWFPCDGGNEGGDDGDYTTTPRHHDTTTPRHLALTLTSQ
jgi:hypothetical protein